MLEGNLSPIIMTRVSAIAESIAVTKNARSKQIHLKKLEILREDEIHDVHETIQLDPIINLSHRILTELEHDALKFGLHHVFPPEKFDQKQFICNMEYFYARLLNLRTAYHHYDQKSANEKVLHHLSAEQLGAASQLRSNAISFQRSATKQMRMLGKQQRIHRRVLRELANDKTIIITRPDKGRGVYHTQVLKLCQDANPDMGERTKVQYLMANLLPSLKMKVISKDPQTIDQFLQIARKAEDLQALVNQDERMNNYSNDSIGTTSNVNFSSASYVAPPLRNNNHQKQQYTQQQKPRSQLEAATTNIPITDSVLSSQQVVSPSTRQQSNTNESSTRKNSNNVSSNSQNYQYHQQPSSNRNRRWNNCDPRDTHPRDAQHF
ncbi:unnamed protein product [Didymodactylos carnosus]|uniref:Uncharacterized protein n=1 Tax=Didymodactylos carnosus TaxID=1234261 RepID=A0A815XDB3_9BILA|nr:unnamed protein product [Didymodactylos carnosus]CAF1556080.1 unnamed protein product [Didymodactylos carnosus]CAF4200735.1 unnamed protein product [Didymodactylos carnosus]CAF4417183.1 unnamed protein product [Didymodactylos carnosus]